MSFKVKDGHSFGTEGVPYIESMGRKAGGIYIDPKKLGGLTKPCMKDTMMFLNCLSLNHNNDEKCVRQKDQLNACMDAQAGKKKNTWGSINYHLQRLSKGRK